MVVDAFTKGLEFDKKNLSSTIPGSSLRSRSTRCPRNVNCPLARRIIHERPSKYWHTSRAFIQRLKVLKKKNREKKKNPGAITATSNSSVCVCNALVTFSDCQNSLESLTHKESLKKKNSLKKCSFYVVVNRGRLMAGRRRAVHRLRSIRTISASFELN